MRRNGGFSTTIPDRAHIRKMLLDCVKDGFIHSMGDLYDFVLQHSNVETEEISKLLPSEWETKFNNMVRWAKTDLINWDLIVSPKRNNFQITELGKYLAGVLAEDYINKKILMLYRISEFSQKLFFSLNNRIAVNQFNAKNKRVLLSYSQKDKEFAQFLVDQLRQANLKIDLQDWSLDASDSFTNRINNYAFASDIVLILLSPNSVNSSWLKDELNELMLSELNNRAITILPVLIKDCTIPKELTNKKYLDLRTNVKSRVIKLINQLHLIPFIDYSLINENSFENLVFDLLSKIGFSIECIFSF